jgi:hypothetical protein
MGARAPAGWYTDPARRGAQRYSDGRDWTACIVGADGGAPALDPQSPPARSDPPTPRPSARKPRSSVVAAGHLDAPSRARWHRPWYSIAGAVAAFVILVAAITSAALTGSSPGVSTGVAERRRPAVTFRPVAALPTTVAPAPPTVPTSTTTPPTTAAPAVRPTPVAAAPPPTSVPARPAPAAGVCATRAPTTAADYQAAFDQLRTANTEWESADGAQPVDLPDGRVVYLFGDTYIGQVAAGGVIDPSHLVRNSFVVQDGSCFLPVMGGSAGSRSSLIPEPAANQWYWPASAVVEGGQLRVFLWRVGPGDPYQVLDMQVATFSLTDLHHVQRVDPLPIPTDFQHPYGATALVAADPSLSPPVSFVYLYGTYQRSAYVARAPVGRTTDPSAWSFYSGLDSSSRPTWSVQARDAVPMTWHDLPQAVVPSALGGVDGNGPFAEPWVNQTAGGFVATAKLVDGFSKGSYAFTAPTPAGPWTFWPLNPLVSVDTTGLLQYGAFTRVTAGGPIEVFNTNPARAADPTPPLTIQTYGPHFLSATRYPA